jgi:hypothetical protein
MSKLRRVLFGVAVALSLLCISVSAIFATNKTEQTRHQECDQNASCMVVYLWGPTYEGYCDYFGPLCGCRLFDEYGYELEPYYERPGTMFCRVS